MKTGAKKRVTSDQANESEAACAALDGERMGSGRLSIYDSGLPGQECWVRLTVKEIKATEFCRVVKSSYF